MADERTTPSVMVMPVRQLLALVLASVVAACGSAGSGRTPVIVDTDLSSDDVIALLYVAQDPRVDLRAVTVSGTGLVHCPGGARIALDVLALAGRRDVPVACGSGIPLAGGNAPPEEWRRAADDLFGVTLPPSSRRAEPDAVRLLASAIEAAPAEPTVLELAPMTNLASVLKTDRAAAARLHRIVAMGGAIDVDGNAPDRPRAEINVWSDPVAARAVLRSGVPVRLLPLDATDQVPVTTFVARALARYQYATPEATLAAQIVAATNMARGGSYFWDPLAAVAMTEPGLVRSSTRRLDVVTRGEAAGRTVPAGDGAATEVVTSVDRPAFERELMHTLLGGAPFAIPAHRPQATVTFDGRGCSYRGASLTAGEVVLDTVNRTDTPFLYVAGRLDSRHTAADLKRYAGTLRRAPEPPKWFTVDAEGMTPQGSRMTWLPNLPTGTTGQTVFLCVTTGPTRVALAASVAVFASR
jgi:inosine-uridine nucleoside N-ribohydrolase